MRTGTPATTGAHLPRGARRRELRLGVAVIVMLSTAGVMSCGHDTSTRATAHEQDADTESDGSQDGPDAALCADASGVTPSVEIGTGLERFEALTDGQEVMLTWGPQGGAHIWSSLRAVGLDPGPANGAVTEQSPLVEFRIEEDGELLSYEYSKSRNLITDAEDVGELFGEIVQFKDPKAANGKTVMFSVTVRDACAVRVSDARSIVILDVAAPR